jgi:hypothetical protein
MTLQGMEAERIRSEADDRQRARNREWDITPQGLTHGESHTLAYSMWWRNTASR